MKTLHRGSNSLFLKLIILSLAAGMLVVTAYALDYLGAGGVLRQVAEHSAKTGDNAAKDAQSKLRADLHNFSESVTNLTPAEAATRWLELVGRAIKLQRNTPQDYNSQVVPIHANDLLAALPPPADWNELAAMIAARPPAKSGGESTETGLRLLAASLQGNSTARDSVITNLQARAKTATGNSAYFYRDLLQQIGQTMLAASDDPNAILQALEYQVSSAKADQSSQTIYVPNLVSQVGKQKAEIFLRQALVAPNALLSFTQPNETSRLAQKLALELMPQLKTAQWGLVNSVDAVELYEAMDKRFATPTNSQASASSTGLAGLIAGLAGVRTGYDEDNSPKRQAKIYYLLGLISHNRSKDAVALAKSFNDQNRGYYFEEAFQSMEQAGYTTELDDFFHELLSQDPTLPFWEQYVEVAVKSGQTDRMIALVRNTLGRADLSAKRKSAFHQIVFKALLAADKVDEAVAEIRQLIAAGVTGQSDESYNNGQLGAMLARLGVLLHKPDWTDEGIKAATKWLSTPAGQDFNNGNTCEVLNTIVQTLYALQRGPEAEALLANALTSASRAGGAQPRYSWESPPTQSILAELATLYHLAGRHQDVLDLLSQSPAWGVADLSGLFNIAPWGNDVSVMWLHTGVSPLPVPYLAAQAYLSIGNKDEAQKITDALLNHYPGLDRGYELLLALQGTNAIPKLDELFSRDQFEERPLIWKAHLLRQEGRLEEAEKIARQAISIDPSDGEEGRGDRMRVYSELADILDARGNQKDADFYRQVVKAIRMSEDADQLYAAGLLKRAIGLYEESLTHFSDAYCIQSRLAIQLAALGDVKAAEEHYRRAYELMPDSFGRVESHCFGCEKVFDGERAQSIAEKVFSQLAIERPDKPQVHYLLGYLRMEEEHYNEARTNFLAAVKLDPDYLNAWVQLASVSEQTLVSPKDRDEIAFNIVRLDPLGRHAQADFSRVTDLVGLWNAVAAAARLQPVTNTNLMALPASQIALDKLPKKPSDEYERFQVMEQMNESRKPLSPAAAVAQTPFVRLAGEMILNNYVSLDE